MKNIALIGSCGSIGRQVLDVVRRHGSVFKIVALVTGSPSAQFDAQVKEFAPAFSAVTSMDGDKALFAAEYPSADVIFNAASGFAGLRYSLKAVSAGKTLALANKETLVCGGELVMPLAERTGAKIIPVDSEHSAIWQCLNFDRKGKVKRLVLTASGGAFKGRKWSELENVTLEQALSHPTWKMGAKITVDSATLMNKGYEVIEAHALFGTPYERIEAVIQPQSIIHSLVEFEDGACIAQMSRPSMEIPIQLALTYPQRLDVQTPELDFKSAFALSFEPLERASYPLFDLALECGARGGSAPCIMNAADEAAVRAYLDGKIKFTRIYDVVSGVLQAIPADSSADFDRLCHIDLNARLAAQKIIDRYQ